MKVVMNRVLRALMSEMQGGAGERTSVEIICVAPTNPRYRYERQY